MNRFKDRRKAPKTALVVDDSRSARYAMRKLLEHHGYTVNTAQSAQDAYLYLQDQQPDTIFLDHQMPDCDGMEMLAELKHNAQTRSIPVVVCSGEEDPAFTARIKAAGAFDVLGKPPQPKHVTRMLQELENPVQAPQVPKAPEVADSRSRLEPQIGTSREVRNPSASYGAPATGPAFADTRPSWMQTEAATPSASVTPKTPSPMTIDALLPALREALEPWIRQRSQAAAREAVADFAERLARELREDQPAEPDKP